MSIKTTLCPCYCHTNIINNGCTWCQSFHKEEPPQLYPPELKEIYKEIKEERMKMVDKELLDRISEMEKNIEKLYNYIIETHRDRILIYKSIDFIKGKIEELENAGHAEVTSYLERKIETLNESLEMHVKFDLLTTESVTKRLSEQDQFILHCQDGIKKLFAKIEEMTQIKKDCHFCMPRIGRPPNAGDVLYWKCPYCSDTTKTFWAPLLRIVGEGYVGEGYIAK